MYEFYWERYLEPDTDPEATLDKGQLIVGGPFEKFEVGAWKTTGGTTIIEIAHEEEISLEDLLNAFSRDLESANYHREYETLDKIVQVLQAELGYDTTLKIVLRLVKEHGTIELFM